MNLAGKTAIVTGGSRGIGYAIARALVSGGANVVITGTRQDTLDEALLQLGGSAGQGARIDAVRAESQRR